MIGCLISYFYTASAFLLASEAHACFRAITAGIIDGKGSSYLSLSWGVPMISLGYNLFMSIMSMGDDRRSPTSGSLGSHSPTSSPPSRS